MSTPHTVAFHTLGCKLNFSETSTLKRSFEKFGYTSVEFEDGADIYVINTCSVTEFADKKCRYEVRRALRYSPNAKIVVVGCYAQLKPKEIADIPGVDLVLGASEKFNILNYIDGLSQSNDKGLVVAGDVKDAHHFVDSFSFGDRTRSFLKVQDGCNYACTFCTIPQARGSSRSDTIDNVLRNAEKIVSQGVKEIVLTGVNIGDFGNGTEVIEGMKPAKEALFFDLMKAIDQVEGLERIRISSIEPNLLTEEMIDFVSTSRLFVPHFHIPLQSGSNEILGKMRRRYKRELYEQRVAWIKKYMPDCCIGVDVIVGFPGETDSHFQETLDFLIQLDISYIHAFTYSERAHTLAAEMENPVPMHVRKKRNEILRNLSLKKKLQFTEPYLDTVQNIITENCTIDGHLSGFTENYIKVLIPQEDISVNQTISVELKHWDEGLEHVVSNRI
ncbi:MAG: tRNA (N(6)-L-threonylcarbamoyladenosine(37)-C(2))-methylthiotransferase MtaB [Lewinellaceae bacterium]|nr:tRNA (N(6)-L-threonylcarbamoyladenosine(37)-C(2))-methylthiotransferase MtaB [Lewinellaceae bacterium]